MKPEGTITFGVISDNGGDQPRAASLVDYAVIIQQPGGGTIIPNGRIQPHGDRPPENVDTQPRRVGYPFMAVIKDDNTVVCVFDDVAAWAECPTPSTVSTGFLPQTGPGGVGGGTTPGGGGPGGPTGGIGGGIGPVGGTD